MLVCKAHSNKSTVSEHMKDKQIWWTKLLKRIVTIYRTFAFSSYFVKCGQFLRSSSSDWCDRWLGNTWNGFENIFNNNLNETSSRSWSLLTVGMANICQKASKSKASITFVSTEKQKVSFWMSVTWNFRTRMSVFSSLSCQLPGIPTSNGSL